MTKQEKQANEALYHVVKLLDAYSEEIGTPLSVKVDHQFYYNDRGHPSRFLDVHLNPTTFFRACVQKEPRGWSCSWAVATRWTKISTGRSLGEGQFDARQLSQLSEVVDHLRRYEHLMTSQEDSP